MAATSLQLVVTTLSLFLSPSLAIPGTYVTSVEMNNLVLDNDLRIISNSPVDTPEECIEFCQKDSKCDGFSFSSFRHVCDLYKMEVGSRPIPKNTFNLYYREKTQSEGYTKFGRNYILFVPVMMDAYNAQANCTKQGGELMPITSADMNHAVFQLMNAKSIFEAYIGITDEAEEQKWVTFNDAANGYTNFNWKGQWPNNRQNCAVITVDGTWKHTNCHNSFYFFCRIPMV